MAYKNLVFEGGGVLGIAFVGALKVLDERDALKDIERIAGTSAGSILALLVSLRYTYEEIHDVMSTLDFGDFEDDPSPLRLATRYGYYKGDFALNFFRGLVEKKLGNKDATFADLQKGGGREMRIFSANLSKHVAQEFSWRTTPDLSLALGVRMSMSIPLFFEAIEYEGDLFADGSTVFNYPITVFDDHPDNETLGLRLLLADWAPEESIGFDHPIRYLKNLVSTIVAAQDVSYAFNPASHKDSVNIDTAGISPVNFKLTAEQKETLVTKGHEAMTAFFDKQACTG